MTQRDREDTALTVRQVRKTFGGVQAVRDVGFDVPEGSLTGLIGPNGAGKTTTLNIISRLIDPDSGDVRSHGTDLLRLRPYEVHAAGVARTFQTPQVFDTLSIVENVMVGAAGGSPRTHLFGLTLGLPGARRHERRHREEAYRWLELVGFRSDPDGDPESLPFGELRLVEVARAAAARPRLLLMDEPSSGLSTEETARFRDVLLRLREEGATILLVEHNMRLVMSAATHVVVLDQGAKLAEGPPSDVRSDPEVQKAYLGGETAPDG